MHHPTVHFVCLHSTTCVLGGSESSALKKGIVKRGERERRCCHGLARTSEEGAHRLEMIKGITTACRNRCLVPDAAEDGLELAFECRHHVLVGVMMFWGNAQSRLGSLRHPALVPLVLAVAYCENSASVIWASKLSIRLPDPERADCVPEPASRVCFVTMTCST